VEPASTQQGQTIGSAKAAEIVRIAESYVGQRFNGSLDAQCAVFVRAVLTKANLNVGVTLFPIDVPTLVH
jgi:hypothetical protein